MYKTEQPIESSANSKKFEELYNTYGKLLFYIAVKRLGSYHDAEDAVQEVFYKVYKNIETVDPVSDRTKALLIVMICNKVTDLIRSKNRYTTVELNDAITGGYTDLRIKDSELAECIQQLPETQRDIIWLKYGYGYDLREISKMLDKSLYAVQKADQRAKKKLYEIYKEDDNSK